MQEENRKIQLIKEAAEDKLARDINVLPIRQEAGIADYFVIMTGRNKNHTQTIADAIDQRLAEGGMPADHMEGMREGSWILLDCGDVLVHIFTQANRDYYDLDELWSE